jgi:hypothetical protein
MSDSPKKTIEKNANGDYVFTAYGEFLSYFHAHLEAFKKFGKFKNFSPERIEEINKKLKAFMAAHVKNVDQYFNNIPKFAEEMNVSKEDLSSFLNDNFLNTLSVVQEKFKRTEIEKFKASSVKTFDRITEEILESTGFRFRDGFRFMDESGVLVLKNEQTGEIIEPQIGGSLASSSNSSTSATAEKKVIPVKVFKDKPLLEEIVELFGTELTGVKLNVAVFVDSEKPTIIPSVSASSEDVLDDIEDLDFEEPDSSQNDYSDTYDEPELNDEPRDYNQPEGVLDDIGDLLGFNNEESSQITATIDPRCEKYNIENYFELQQKVNNFQTKQDTEGYQNWLNNSDELIKIVLSLRSYILKEIKAENVNWKQVIEQLSTKTEFNKDSIDLIKNKISNFQWIKVALDRATAEFKKGDAEFLNLVKKAWPYIQNSFMLAPDYDAVLTKLKSILSKVGNENHRKELVRILTITLNFCKSKFNAD